MYIHLTFLLVYYIVIHYKIYGHENTNSSKKIKLLFATTVKYTISPNHFSHGLTLCANFILLCT